MLKRKIRDVSRRIEEMEKKEAHRRAEWEQKCAKLQREYDLVKVCPSFYFTITKLRMKKPAPLIPASSYGVAVMIVCCENDANLTFWLQAEEIAEVKRQLDILQEAD